MINIFPCVHAGEDVKPPSPPLWDHPAWPRFDYDSRAAEAPLARLSELGGELTGLQAGLSETDRLQSFVHELASEAVHSFAIEGVSLNRTDLQASIVASLQGRALEGAGGRGRSVADLMLDARRGGVLDEARLHDWRLSIFGAVGVEDLGRWRTSEMVIVKSAVAGREEILYKAPPPDRVATEMATFFTALAEPTPAQPTPIRAALAHLWFESIHPYSDGNGRIGRAIIEHIFAAAPTWRSAPFSLSRRIERDKAGYYDALQAGRRPLRSHIDATPFVVWLLETAAKAVRASAEEARFIARRNAFFLTWGGVLSPRQEAVLRRIFQEGAARVDLGVSPRAWMKIARVSRATATRDLADLAQKGVVFQSEAGGRSTAYLLKGFEAHHALARQ